MPSSWLASKDWSRSPSSRRMPAIAAKVRSRPSSDAASTASSGPAVGTPSTDSITPRRPRMPSRLGGVASCTRRRSSGRKASTCSNASTLICHAAWPWTRAAVRLRVTLPRRRYCAARCRAGTSMLSKPGGIRSRMSSPLPLTLRASQDHAQSPVRPSTRAKPVIDDRPTNPPLSTSSPNLITLPRTGNNPPALAMRAQDPITGACETHGHSRS